MKDLINWKALSRYLAGNDTSVSRTRCPKKYQSRVDNFISTIEAWAEKKEEKASTPDAASQT